MIGKDIGNKCLMDEISDALQKEVKLSILENFFAQDWEYILSRNYRHTKGVWRNLFTWIKLSSEHEKHFSYLVGDFGTYSSDDILTNEDVVEAYLLGKKYRIDKWISVCANALSRLDGPLNLEQLQLEDWTHILSGLSELRKELWMSLKEWIKIFPQHEHQFPKMLANFKYVSWHSSQGEFSNAEIEELFMIGKEIGNRSLMRGMFTVLQEEVEVSSLKEIWAEDWKCILSDNDITRGVWSNLLSWIKLNQKHEEHFAVILADCSWYNCMFTDEDVAEAYLLGKKHEIDKLMSRCAGVLSRLDSALNLEQLQLEDLQKIINMASGTCCLVENLLLWSRLKQAAESLPLLV
jgi:hypothetical protein